MVVPAHGPPRRDGTRRRVREDRADAGCPRRGIRPRDVLRDAGAVLPVPAAPQTQAVSRGRIPGAAGRGQQGHGGHRARRGVRPRRRAAASRDGRIIITGRGRREGQSRRDGRVHARAPRRRCQGEAPAPHRIPVPRAGTHDEFDGVCADGGGAGDEAAPTVARGGPSFRRSHARIRVRRQPRRRGWRRHGGAAGLRVGAGEARGRAAKGGGGGVRRRSRRRRRGDRRQVLL